jgi:MYXO-CTERM domain-containing protein
MRTLPLLAMLMAVNAIAVPFSLDFTWQPVANIGGNSGDRFQFTFNEPTGSLRVTEMTVTLGSGLIFDLTSSGPGYLTWGAFETFDGGTGATLTSAPPGEGAAGNRTLTWTFSNFTHGATFEFRADVDENRSCASGLAGIPCRVNADTLTGNGFSERGGIDLTYRVDFINGAPGPTVNAPWSGEDADTNLLQTQSSAGGAAEIPEPSTWLLGAAGLLGAVLLRRRA